MFKIIKRLSKMGSNKNFLIRSMGVIISFNNRGGVEKVEIIFDWKERW